MSQSDGFFSQVEVCQYSKETEASHPRGGGTEARLVPRHGAVISHDAEAQTWKQQQQQKNIKLEIITEQRTLGSSPPPRTLMKAGFQLIVLSGVWWMAFGASVHWLPLTYFFRACNRFLKHFNTGIKMVPLDYGYLWTYRERVDQVWLPGSHIAPVFWSLFSHPGHQGSSLACFNYPQNPLELQKTGVHEEDGDTEPVTWSTGTHVLEPLGFYRRWQTNMASQWPPYHFGNWCLELAAKY